MGFGAVGRTKSATFESARNLAIGIGIQNFPEVRVIFLLILFFVIVLIRLIIRPIRALDTLPSTLLSDFRLFMSILKKLLGIGVVISTGLL